MDAQIQIVKQPYLYQYNQQKTVPVFHPRLAWMLYYQQVHNIRKVCEKFKISRKTFYKWWTRYQKSGYDPNSLFDFSRKPHNSPFATPQHIIQKVIEAKMLTGYGQKKLKMYLLEKHNIRISEHTIWKLLKKHYSNDTINQLEKIESTDNKLPGEVVYLLISSLSKNLMEVNTFVFTAFDISTRLRISRIYREKNINNIIEFLNFILKHFPFKIENLKCIEKNVYNIINIVKDEVGLVKISLGSKYEKDFIISEVQKNDEDNFILKHYYNTIDEFETHFMDYIRRYNNHISQDVLKGLTPLQKLRKENVYKNVIYFDYKS